MIPGHGSDGAVAPVTMRAGESLAALKTPSRMPVPGGFRLGLASEDPAIIAVETLEGSMGASRVTLQAVAPGTVTVHYVNNFAIGGDARTSAQREALREYSLQAFEVTVRTEGP